jgi:glycosyltransferase involved in cell wall biosynthesis
VIGYFFLEKQWLKPYRGLTTITVSRSTKDDLLSWGFKNVIIAPEGLGFKPLDEPRKKESQPTFLFVGRLKKAKMPDDAIRAFKIIKGELPEARLWIVGDGYMMNDLKKMTVKLFGSRSKPLVQDNSARGIKSDSTGSTHLTDTTGTLNMDDSGSHSLYTSSVNKELNVVNAIQSNGDVTFFARLPVREKLELMSRAHVLLVPAIREGWGLVVTEANAMGTPAVAYDVPGLQDSVMDEITGTLVTRGDHVALAIAAIDLIKDKTKMKMYTTNALRNANHFTWDRTASYFHQILSHELLNEASKNKGESNPD